MVQASPSNISFMLSIRYGVSPLNAISKLLICQFFKVFFAICASLLVKGYASYAKHSGIPEIKTVLGGFVIKQFMGVWTLIVKSLGLVKTLLAPFVPSVMTLL